MGWLNNNLGLLTLILILVGAVTLFFSWKSRPKNLRIIKAFYGRNGHYKNLARKLNDKIVHNKLEILLTNKINGDPYEGVQKIAVIEYSYNGRKLKREYIEGEIINLP
jgi:hypothetical protein